MSSEIEILDTEISNISSSNPDYDIEVFWFHLKNSMYNFYNSNQIISIERPISLWSDTLNEFQLDKKYEKIEENIRNYISLFAIDLMKCCNFYHIGILMTNLKRWDKITKKYKINIINFKYYNVVFVLLDIMASLSEYTQNVVNTFNNIEIFIIYNDFTFLIKLAVDIAKPGILDKLLKYNPTIHKDIERIYNLPADSLRNTSGRKIIRKLNENSNILFNKN